MCAVFSSLGGAQPVKPDEPAVLARQVTDRRDRAHLIADQMSSLPDTTATALRVVLVHGMSLAEAAAWMGLTIDDVRSAVTDGLQHLSQSRQDCGQRQTGDQPIP